MGIIIQTKQRGKKCKYDINPKRTPQIGLNRTGAKCFNHSNSTVLILQQRPQTSKPKHEIYTLQFLFDEGWFPYDRRRSRIADRRSQRVLRSSAIIWKPTSAIVFDRLRSCDHMETKVLRSAIETYPIIILILTQMIQRFFCSNKA